MRKLKDEVVVNEEKGYTRYKIYSRYKKGKTGYSRHSIFVYAYKDKLIVSSFKRYGKYGDIPARDSDYFVIKYVRGNFGLYKGKKCAHISSNFLNNPDLKCFAACDRLNKILKRFSLKYGHTYRAIKTANMFTLILRLIYPSLQHKKNSQFDNYIHALVLPYNTSWKKLAPLYRLYLPLNEIIRRSVGFCGKSMYKEICKMLKKSEYTYYITIEGIIERIKLLNIIGFDRDFILSSMKTDWFIQIPLYMDYLPYKEFFQAMSKNKILEGNNHLYDAIRMWNELGRPNIKGKNIQKIHDDLAVILQTRNVLDFELFPSESHLKLDGLQIEGYTIVVPKTNHELISWGAKMSNCIASYAQIARNQSKFIFGVKKGDELVYNVMYSNADSTSYRREKEGLYIDQFYGKCNTRVDKKVVDKILAGLPFEIYHNGFGGADAEEETTKTENVRREVFELAEIA